MAKSEPTNASASTLYQSEWWSRLAAINEKGSVVREPETKSVRRPGLLKTLGSFFEPLTGGRLITSIVKTN